MLFPCKRRRMENDSRDHSNTYISYADEQIFCKRTENCEFEEEKINTTLTQEETFKFDCKKMVQIQLRILTNDGKVPPIEVIEVPVKKCLDDEVLA